jgi:hypothetical protein
MSKARARRRRHALAYLEAQLVRGTKREKVRGEDGKWHTTDKMVPMSKHDFDRVADEIRDLRKVVGS